MLKPKVVIAAGVLAAVAGAGLYLNARAPEPQSDARPQTFKVTRRDFVKGIRLSGTVEAVEATTISTPRLAGQNNNSLIVTTLVRAGKAVHQGDLLVEFDRQEQIRNALDKQAELNDLEQQVRKRRAQEDAAKAADDSTLKQAESAQQRAQLEIVKNEMIPKIEAEKNLLALEEARAKLIQLQQTYDLKREAAAADIKVLEIRRDRAQTAMQEAASNAERMLIKSPIDGIAVIKTTWKNRNMAEIQEGDEVRAGVPVVDVVNPSTMRVRARVNQADIDELQVGQPVRVGLDAVSGLEVCRTHRSDLADRRSVESLAEGPELRRPHRHRRFASEPHAGPHGVARRAALARAWSARRPPRRGRARGLAGFRPCAAWRELRTTERRAGRHEHPRDGRHARTHGGECHRQEYRAGQVMTFRRFVNRRMAIVAAVAVVVIAGGFVMATRADVAPNVPMIDVVRGDFVDYLQLRGDIRPAKSIVLSAPTQAGELQIVKLAKNGTPVKAGDVLVEFDATTLKQRMQEKLSELKQSDAEIAQVQAQQRITQEQDQTAVMKARYRPGPREARSRKARPGVEAGVRAGEAGSGG